MHKNTAKKYRAVVRSIAEGKTLSEALKTHKMSSVTYYKLRKTPVATATPAVTRTGTTPTRTTTDRSVAIVFCRPDQVPAIVARGV